MDENLIYGDGIIMVYIWHIDEIIKSGSGIVYDFTSAAAIKNVYSQVRVSFKENWWL